MFVHLNIFYLKDVREQCDKLKETVSSKDKKLARMNKAFGNKVNITQLVFLILIYWIEIYAVHNAVHFLNNWDTEKVYDVVSWFSFISLSFIRFSTIFNLTGWRGEEVNSRKHSIEGKRAKVGNIQHILAFNSAISARDAYQLSESKGGYLFEGCLCVCLRGSGAWFLVQNLSCLPFVGINKNGNFNTQPKLCVDLYTSLAFNVLSSLRAE